MQHEQTIRRGHGNKGSGLSCKIGRFKEVEDWDILKHLKLYGALHDCHDSAHDCAVRCTVRTLFNRAKLWRRRFTAFFPVTRPFYIRSAMLLHYTWHCLCNHSCHCVTSRTSQPAGYVSSNISKSPSIIPKMCKHIIYHMYIYIYI